MLHERHLPIVDQVEIGGRSLRVVRWVASPGQTAAPLLFFSGIGGNAELLAPFHEALGGRDILTFDMPGIGGSSPAGGPYRPSTIASLAAKILTAFKQRIASLRLVPSKGGWGAREKAIQPSSVTATTFLSHSAEANVAGSPIVAEPNTNVGSDP